MDYQAVIDELCRFAEAQKKLAAKSRQHPTVKRQAEVVAAVFIGLAAALEAGMNKKENKNDDAVQAKPRKSRHRKDAEQGRGGE